VSVSDHLPNVKPTVPCDEESVALPASFAQQRLWFLDQLESQRAVYNVPLLVRLRGELDTDALRRAIELLVERHESLRTTFMPIDGTPHQIVAPPRGVTLPVIDLRGRLDAEQAGLAFAEEEAARPFDLSAGPLLRATVLRIADEDHLLAITMHHIVADAWSVGVFNRELSAAFGALVAGGTPVFPELPIQYGDYAVWQQQWMSSGALDQELDYWKGHLAGAPALLEMPTDHPRPEEQSFRGAIVGTVLTPAVLDRVKALGDRFEATLFMTLLSTFYCLLSRYSGQDDIVVGTAIANRSRVELEGLMGMFVNTLALRANLHDDPSFGELLSRVRECALGAFANQDVPFEKLVEELRPERHLQFPPVAQVLFVLQPPATSGMMLSGLEHERLRTTRTTAKFDLSLFAAEGADGLRVSLEYCTDLFDESTMVAMLEHFELLLASAIADPDCPVSRLPMLNEAERSQPFASNELARSASLAGCVHELVAARARLAPEEIAAVFNGEELTYGQLDSRANRLARHLGELGVGADVMVAIAAERSLEMVVAVLAVIKAGGAYVPVDPGYPRERVAFMLTDTDAAVVLTQKRFLEQLPSHSAITVCLDDDRELIASYDDAALDSHVTPDNLAYVIYTSGSTGQPKGVAMSHRPLVNLLGWQLANWTPPDAARTLQLASLSFDVAFQEIFSTWCSGGTLVLVGDEARRDPRALLALLAEQKVERLFLPFVALQSLSEAAERYDLSVASLRDVITAGEQLKMTVPVRRFFERNQDCALFNQYGPTESHVVTAHRLSGSPTGWPTLPPIGRPIANVKIYVLDRHQHPVPVGVPGELHIGGHCLARGYLNRPDLTAERFIDDPFARGEGARMYATGDLARFTRDGNIQFLGRIDDQVKIRGFRVDLGEIEVVLARHPEVVQAVAMLRTDDSGDARLIGYIVRRPGSEVASAALLDHARDWLPDYMLPQHFVFMEQVPLTPSGKVDRKSLPVAGLEARARSAYVPPETHLEQSLAEIWKLLLKIDPVGIDDDFFELGGHSLLAVQLVHAIEEGLRRTCTLPVLFRNRTIRSLAHELHVGGADVTTPTVLRLQSRGAWPALFCIGGVHVYQELADALAPDVPTYGIFLPSEQELFELEHWKQDHRHLSVKEMASGYVDAVRAEQPIGPYLLLGLCFGGVVAYEAAQQLISAGEDVALLVMLDTILPSAVQRATPSLRARVRKGARGAKAASADLRQRLRIAASADPASVTRRLAEARRRIYTDAKRGYEVRPYAGSAVLVRPEVTLAALGEHLVDPSFGWHRYVHTLEVHDVAGDHITHLKQPNVDGLVATLRPLLKRAAEGKG
jgi:amino acid adenylation domain-containing protein